MTTTAWISIISLGLLLLLLIVLLIRGYGPAIRTLLAGVWNSPIGKNIIVVVALIFAGQLVKTYARFAADEKASDWLTQYNGKATTEVVGAIKADVPTLFTVPSASPSPLPSQSPSPTPTPTPSPSPVTETTASTNALGSSTSRESTSPTPTPSPTPTEMEQARLQAQLQVIRDRTKHHGNVMAYFYVNYFVSIVMVMTAGLVVAISLFFISQIGWTGASSYVKSAFIVASAYMAFYGLFPPVFQQEKNIKDNKELFLHYKSLENEVDSYPITLMTLKAEPKTPREFINHVDAEMDRLGDIALGFDITKVSYEKAIELPTPRPAPSATPTPSPSPPKK